MTQKNYKHYFILRLRNRKKANYDPNYFGYISADATACCKHAHDRFEFELLQYVYGKAIYNEQKEYVAIMGDPAIRDEIQGSLRDVAFALESKAVVHSFQTKEAWMHIPIQAVFELHIKGESSKRYLGLCWPSGYQLLERGKDDSWKPLSAQASPADIKETLAALLKSCSPRYASLWTQELEKRLASLATDCGKDDD
eukprot:g80470.t1